MPTIDADFVMLGSATTRNYFDIMVKVEDYCVILSMKTQSKCFGIIPKTEQYCEILGMISCSLVIFQMIHYRLFLQIPLNLTGHPLWILS